MSQDFDINFNDSIFMIFLVDFFFLYLFFLLSLFNYFWRSLRKNFNFIGYFFLKYRNNQLLVNNIMLT